MKPQNYKVKGFTLIEMIIVMMIFGLIMSAALTLMSTTSSVFTTSYKSEAVSSAATSITDYFDSSLRYAEHVLITQDVPTTDSIREFVDNNYNGKIYQIDSSGTMGYANGDVYVMKVDNVNGGVISTWKLQYQAGDERMADETADDIPTTLSGTFDVSSPDNASVINSAFYQEYRFNVSLGIFQLVDGKLVRDNDYYNAFTDVSKQAFGMDNFGLTVTAYEYSTKAGKEKDRSFDASVGTYTYAPGFIFNSTMSFPNMMYDSVYDEETSSWKRISASNYFAYEWKKNDADPSNPEHELAKDKDGNVMTPAQYLYKDISAERNSIARSFSCNVSNMAEPDVFYILYTYCNDDIV